jgi:hypothetical protein
MFRLKCLSAPASVECHIRNFAAAAVRATKFAPETIGTSGDDSYIYDTPGRRKGGMVQHPFFLLRSFTALQRGP